MTKLGATEAAKRWGVSRQLIYKDWKRGKLAYTVNDDGQKEVDVSEMIRVYGDEPPTPVSDDDTETDNHVNSPPNDESQHYLDEYIATLKQQLIEKETQLIVKDEQLSKRDYHIQSLINQMSEMTKLLSVPESQQEPEDDYIEDDPEPEKAKRRWWQFGRKVEEV